MSRLLTLTACVLCFSLASVCQQKYSRTQLLEDLEVFGGALQDMHAGLYWYQSPEDFRSQLDEIKSQLKEQTTELDFFRQLSPVIAQIGCGHTWIAGTDELKDGLWRKGKLLPLSIKVIDGITYCTANNSTNVELEPGDRIESINGCSMDSLFSVVHRNTPGDGYIKTGERSIAERFFPYFYLLYIDQPATYQIVYNRNGNTLQTEIVALTEDEIDSQGENKRKENAELIRLEIDGNIATLTIDSFEDWSIGKLKRKFVQVLASKMSELAESGAENLILDLRNNGGGDDDFGLKLFSYFHPDPIVEFRVKEFRTVKPKFLKYADLSSFQFGFLKLSASYDKVNDSTYHLKKDKTLKPHKASEPQFNGNLYVLQGGRSYSTTADVLALLKSYDRAVLVGEESGGGYYGNTSGISMTIKLPNTGIQLGVPFIRYTTNVRELEPKGRGVSPHHLVTPTIQDILEGRDSQLEFVYELIGVNE